MTCEQVQRHLDLYLYGELDFDQEEALDQHLQQCPRCQAELASRRALHRAIDRSALEPSPALLARSRRQLLAQLDARRAHASRWRSLLDVFSGKATWLKPAGAVALLAAGFLAGRNLPSPDSGVPFAATQPATVVATRVRNVEPDPSGRVRIVLEETRQRVVSGKLADGRIRQLLLAAAQDPADPGLRVESVELLRQKSADEEIRRALLTALERDPNPGVRLKALEGLRPYSADPTVRRTLAQVLLRDDNVGLRTQAIDLLTEHRPTDVVGVLQQLMQQEENDYIRLRTQRALRELKASVETF
jgi:hypothetical protein